MANLPLPKPVPPANLKTPTVLPVGGSVRPAAPPPSQTAQPHQAASNPSPPITKPVLPPTSTGGVGAVSPVKPPAMPAQPTVGATTIPSAPVAPTSFSTAPTSPSVSTAPALTRPVGSPIQPAPSLGSARPTTLSVAPPIPTAIKPSTTAPVIAPLPTAPQVAPVPTTSTVLATSSAPQVSGIKPPVMSAVIPPSAPTTVQPLSASGATLPTQNAAPVTPPPLARPPQTMTALSSVSANKLPPGASTTAPPPPTTPTPPPDVEFAKPKKSIFKFLPMFIGVLLIVLVAVFGVMWFLNRDSGSTGPDGSGASGTGTSNGSNSGTSGTGGNTDDSATGSNGSSTTGQQVVLQYWGLWEPSETMQQIITDFQKTNSNVSVQYVKQSHKDYRSRVQNAIKSGNGPDIFRFHASWVPMFSADLAPLPSAVMSSSEFQNTFYPVAGEQIQANGTPVGIPLMYEGLALYYNVDMLNTALVQPPKTWSELQVAARTLTVREGGVVKRAGVALGNSTNVEHFSDIVALLMLQSGADFTKPNSPETRGALLFYTKFMSDDVWSNSLPSSSVAFARGDVAMIFAPSWRAHEIKQMNPGLDFATVPVPQLTSQNKITWANYWAEGVSTKSKHQKEAWQFLKYLSSKEVQQKLFSAQSETRSFGEIYSRVDLGDSLAADKVVGSFVIDAPKAKGWYMSSNTHDDGINDEIIGYYADAISSLLSGNSPDEVLQTLDSGVQQVLTKYGVSSKAKSI